MERQSTSTAWSVAVTSASALALEVGLLRLFSLVHFYHFATLSVSVAFLGLGAGGTLMVLRPGWAGRLHTPPGRALWGQAGLVLASYLLLNHLPLDTFQLAWSRTQWLILLGYYAALVLPFLWAGLVVSSAFVLAPEASHRLYMANLVGSAVGAGAALAGQALPHGWGAVAVAAAFPLVGAMSTGGGRRVAPAALLLLAAALAAGPAVLAPQLSPHKRLRQLMLQPETRLLETVWSPAARLDAVASPAIRSAPGLSLNFAGEVPAGQGLTIDGDNLSSLVEVGGPYLDALPEALPYALARPERVLLLYPRGGLQVSLALRAGTKEVVALEELPALAALARRLSPLLADPALELGAGGLRASLAREKRRFPLVLLPLPDSFQTVSAGSYSLRESYIYTLEGFRDLWQRVERGGFLAVTRWLQVPPSEDLRAWALVLEATQAPPDSLAAYRSFQTVTILAKRGPLAPRELALIRQFTAARSYDLVYLPGLTPGEVNRFNRLPEPLHVTAFAALLGAADRQAFYADYSFRVAPPTDDQPFFFHFFKLDQWPELRARLGRTYEPFAGAGILFLFVLLGLSTLASLLLILSPAALLGPALPLRIAPLLYFAALGLGFLFIEIALIQKLILLVGEPVYAVAVVLVGLLSASGLGSLLSIGVPPIWPAGLLAVVAAALPFLLDVALPVLLAWPLWLRVLAALLLVAPLGLLMGMPFPQGLASLAGGDARWIPWAWAINGATSVTSALLANLISLGFGLRALLWLAAGSYALAALAQAALPRWTKAGPSPRAADAAAARSGRR